MLRFETRNYAHAIVELAHEEHTLTEEITYATNLRALLADHPLAIQVLRSEFITHSEKEAIVTQALTDHLSTHMRSLLLILIRRNSCPLLLDILDDIIRLGHAELGIVAGVVYSPTPLTSLQILQLEQSTSRQSGLQVRLTNIIDPALLAGLRIEVDNHVTELSFNSLLEEAKAVVRSRFGGRRWL